MEDGFFITADGKSVEDFQLPLFYDEACHAPHLVSSSY